MNFKSRLYIIFSSSLLNGVRLGHVQWKDVSVLAPINLIFFPMGTQRRGRKDTVKDTEELLDSEKDILIHVSTN